MPPVTKEGGRRTEEIEEIADEIARYASQHMSGADTVEGITKWWIPAQRLREAEDKVREAVESLCERGVMQKRVLADGTVLYSAAGPAEETSK